MPDLPFPAALASIAAAVDLIQFHVLTAFPPHNVNRDEDGRPKTCSIGGVLRGRISSQAKKRALRYAPHFPKTQRAVRTREAGIHVFRRLTAAGIDDLSAVWAALAVNMATGGGTDIITRDAAKVLVDPDPKKDKRALDDREKALERLMQRMGLSRDDALRHWLERECGTEQGLVISTREFARIEEGLDALVAAHRAGGDVADTLEAWVKSVCKDKLLTRDDHDLDTALFGRMVAADPTFNVEAACAVGHAFTTHAFTAEGDYFSAGEELNELKGTGAAITSYAFFGGGVYYQHAVLDCGHLRLNLSHGRAPEEAERLTTQAVDAFLTGLLFAQPKGKRNGHASDVGASYVLVSRGGDPSLNLGVAFLEPVRVTETERDLMTASIGRLRTFHATMTTAYGLRNAVRAFNAHGPARGGNAPADSEVWTLNPLRDFVLGPAVGERGV